MFTSIHERVNVAGVFPLVSQFVPRKFKWRDKVFKVDLITIISDFKDSGLKKRMYSIKSANNLYRLVFIRDFEEWWLEEIWAES